MKDEIEKALVGLQIEGKEARKTKARNILIIVAFAVLFYLVPYAYPQYSALFVIFALLALFGGIYIVWDAIPAIYQPLKPEFYAFKEIARTVQILEKSNEPIAYEEAYRCLRHAHRILENIDLDDLGWYDETNETVKRFLENLQSIVLPAITNNNIRKEHLREIAIALYSMDPSRIAKVNKTLETETTYKKSGPSQTKVEAFTKKLQETTVGNVAYSLALGYGLILGICIIYIALTGQDFMTFVKERPDVVILGGGVFSGLTFWRTKPHTERKSATIRKEEA
jgi:hypothetical protein